MRRAVDRQIRRSKVRYAFSRSLYACEFLMNPVAVAVVAPLLDPRLVALSLLVLVALYVQLVLLNRATSVAMTAAQHATTPLLDLLKCSTQNVPLFSNDVTRRGYRARITRGTQMIAITA